MTVPPKNASEYAKLTVESLAAHQLGDKLSLESFCSQRSFWMPFQIDGSLYPDSEVPTRLETVADRVDFLARLCAAWDFGLLPDQETVATIRSSEWREAVDACRLLTSPTYHLLRQWHNLPPLPYLGRQLPHIRNDPNLAYV